MTDIVIKPADKGSATVIISKDDYETKVMDHLNNAQFYDPTRHSSEEIVSFLADMFERQIIDREAFDFLLPKNVRTSIFYTTENTSSKYTR